MLIIKIGLLLIGLNFISTKCIAQDAIAETRDKLLDLFLFMDLSSLEEDVRKSFQDDRENFGWLNLKKNEVSEVVDIGLIREILKHEQTKERSEKEYTLRKGVDRPLFTSFYYKVRNYYVVVHIMNMFDGEVDDDGYPKVVFGKDYFSIFDLQFNHKVTYAL